MTSRLAQMQVVVKAFDRCHHKWLKTHKDAECGSVNTVEYLCARFQQKQMQEKEEKLLRLYENQQQRAFERVGRGSAGSNSSLGSTGGGKVRQMFDERRQKAGIDRSHPLEPLKNSRVNGHIRGNSTDRLKNNTTTRTVVKSTVQKSVSQIRNGKPIVNKREVVHSVYNNNNGDESYEERRYVGDNNDHILGNSHRNLVDMMNNHNLNDELDNEELPQIGFDEVDEPYITGKLANVGGKLPSQINQNTLMAVAKSVETKPPQGISANITPKRETKPSVRKTVKAASPPVPTNNSLPNSKSNSSLKSPSKAMSNKPADPSPRAPSSTRPSAKQTPRSAVVRDDLSECKYCNRRFATDRLHIHEDICSKTGKKKRKAYDSTKHRVQGTELEPFVKTKPGSKALSSKTSKIASKKDWRKTHDEFIAAIRSAKMAQAHIAKGGKLSDLPPPPPSSNPDYIQCPHCGRRFNEAAAERHIPKCANFQFNKPKPGAAAKGKPSGKR